MTLATALALWAPWRRQSTPDPPTSRFLVQPPEKATYVEYPSISPDGRRLAFVATVDGKTQLWVRPIDSLTAHALAGTEDAGFPFWSPDNRFLGFFASGKLKKVDVSGSPPLNLCDAATLVRGGAWNHDGVLVFPSGPRDGLRRVSAAGGVPTPFTKLDSACQHGAGYGRLGALHDLHDGDSGLPHRRRRRNPTSLVRPGGQASRSGRRPGDHQLLEPGARRPATCHRPAR